MIRIGEFSKLSHLTVKALRFYEREGLLIPSHVDEYTGYRLYETSQLADAAKIKSYRQLDLSIDEIKQILSGKNVKDVLFKKEEELQLMKNDIDSRLSIISHLLEERSMKYQVTVKEIPACIVYYAEAMLEHYSDMMIFIPDVGEQCAKLNPELKCSEPDYEFCENLDCEYKESNVHLRFNQAVTSYGKENELIHFREIPATRVLSIMHKGAYEQLGEAYAYIMKYAEENGYEVSGYARESYIDGIWNKESVNEWLTEIQLPIKRK